LLDRLIFTELSNQPRCLDPNRTRDGWAHACIQVVGPRARMLHDLSDSWIVKDVMEWSSELELCCSPARDCFQDVCA